MNIRWDYFVNQYDTTRYVSSADGRDNRHIQFVREFASVVSVLQVRVIHDHVGRSSHGVPRIKQIV